jgi:hypothetical protein
MGSPLSSISQKRSPFNYITALIQQNLLPVAAHLAWITQAHIDIGKDTPPYPYPTSFVSRLASHRLVETSSFHKPLASRHRPSSPPSHILLTIVLAPSLSVASQPLAISPFLYVETLSCSTDLATLYKKMCVHEEFRISSTCVYPISFPRSRLVQPGGLPCTVPDTSLHPAGAHPTRPVIRLFSPISLAGLAPRADEAELLPRLRTIAIQDIPEQDCDAVLEAFTPFIAWLEHHKGRGLSIQEINVTQSLADTSGAIDSQDRLGRVINSVRIV